MTDIDELGSFQTAITVKQIMNGINSKYFLPGIQREFVWKEWQILQLFDSILRGYPIGSFLFWRVNGSNVQEFIFYDFIKDYHEKDKKHNQKNSLNGIRDITAILDGQQRLGSLYIGLKGSFAIRKYRGRKDNDRAYPKKKLYLNLSKLNNNDDSDIGNTYMFEFRENAVDNSSDNHWFEVGKILDFKVRDVTKYILDNHLQDAAADILSTLYEKINESIINYYLEESGSLHRVLKIFVRVNSAGTPLSYSDLLLSILSSDFTKIDIREEMHNFVDEVNNKLGYNFDINKDFVLKTALLLLDKDTKFKVDNFTLQTNKEIEDNFERIIDCIRTSYQLLGNYGFDEKTLSSNYPAAIISYYLFKKKGINLSRFLTHKDYQELREIIRILVIKTLLMSIYSSSLDTVLSSIRRAVQVIENKIVVDYKIDIDKINGKLATNKKLTFSDEMIKDDLVELCYGHPKTFLLLSLLYPDLDLKTNHFHVDHIYPKSKFNKNTLKGLGFLNDDKIQEWKNYSNQLGNLQLLVGTVNVSKNSQMPEDWLNNDMKGRNKDYKEKNYIDPSTVLNWDNFEKFFKDREGRLLERLKIILNA